MALNVSPYGTPFTLWQRFAHGRDIDPIEHSRMTWGTRLEPIIIAAAAEEQSLVIQPNVGTDGKQAYFRRGLIGATRDATIITPDRGAGAFDSKCVFDYRTWMQNWDGGKSMPRHIEIQLQCQMLVGDGTKSFDHGRVVAFVGGELHYFDREPIPKVWREMELVAEKWFDDLRNKRPGPDPFGDPVEAPWLALLDRPKGSRIDLTENIDLAEKIRLYEWSKAEQKKNEKTAAVLKAQILAEIGENEGADCFGGINVKVQKRETKASTIERKAFTSLTLKSYVPENLPDSLMDAAGEADLGG